MKRILLSISIAFLAAVTVYAKGERTIKGQVFGDDGFPLAGASVVLAGTTTGTVVDSLGNYSIRATEDDVILFSFIGYTEVRKKVEKNTVINVVLKLDTKLLEETVVIGYGTVKKADLTGSVEVVTMDKINTPVYVSADQALQGRIAGVDVMSAGGEPGAGTSIRIRGTRSISAGNDPLIVVDGVIDAYENFSDINPDDIKNITVLKDASATAIYGARGSNGVILVTTKGEESSKLGISLTASVGASQLPKELDVMNATEFAQYRNDLKYIKDYYLSDPTTPVQSGTYPFSNPSVYGDGTDWQKTLTRTGVTQKYLLAVNKGDSKSHFYFSFGYDNDQGIIIGSDMQRYTTFFKGDYKFFKWLTAGIRLNYAYRHNDLNKIKINGTSAYSAVALSPMLNPTDVWNKYSDNSTSGASVYDSPYLQAMYETNYRNTSYFNITPWVEIRPVNHLVLKSTLAYSVNGIENYYYSPASMPVATARDKGGTAQFSSTDKTNWLSETTLTYSNVLARMHKLDVMAGFTGQSVYVDNKLTKGVGYLDDNVGPYNLSGLLDKRNLTVTSGDTKVTRMSVIARANYSYRSRYYLTLTGRADGSSIFAEGHKWAFFPAVAFKWSLSNEKWMTSARSSGTSLAIRLSAGRSGNDAVSSYVSQATLSSSSATWLFGDIQQVSYYPTRLGNENLTWEKTSSANIGIDLGLLHERILLKAEAYVSKTDDLLLALQNASATGYTTRYANVGDTQGYGLEFSITSRNIVKPKFYWETTLTVSHDNSIVTDVGVGNEYIPTYSQGTQMLFGYKKGYPVNALWGYQFCGVWHNDEERALNKTTKAYVSYQDKNGYSKYADVNHDGVLDKNDMVYLGSSDPLLYGGFNNSFNIHHFNIGLYFTYSIGGNIYNLTEAYIGSAIGSSNKYRYMSDGWHPARNPDSDIPSAYSSDSYYSDRYVHDASYLRLKTLSLGYTFNLSKSVRWLSDIVVTAYAENLFLVSGYNGFDPDVTASKSVRRLDDASYPNPRTFMLSVKIRY